MDIRRLCGLVIKKNPISCDKKIGLSILLQRTKEEEMKKLILSVMILVFLNASASIMGAVGVSFADDLKIAELAKAVPDLKQEIAPGCKEEMARSGCCSWHGGVCGCYLGRVVCCDGTFSPSCLCNRDSIKEVTDSKPENSDKIK